MGILFKHTAYDAEVGMRTSGIMRLSSREQVTRILVKAGWMSTAAGACQMCECCGLDCHVMFDGVSRRSRKILLEFSLSTTFAQSLVASDLEIGQMYATRGSVLGVSIDRVGTNRVLVNITYGITMPYDNDVVTAFYTYALAPFAEFIVAFRGYRQLPEEYVQLLCLEQEDDGHVH